MTFKKDFPSLKDIECNCYGCNEYPSERDELHSVSIEDIQKYCLDKQKVRGAIEKHMVCGHSAEGIHYEKVCRKCCLLKELGL
jgi:hypothetical protein